MKSKIKQYKTAEIIAKFTSGGIVFANCLVKKIFNTNISSDMMKEGNNHEILIKISQDSTFFIIESQSLL